MRQHHAVLLVSLVVVCAAAPSQVAAQTDPSSGSVTITVTDLPPQVSPYVGIPATGGTTATCPAGQSVIGIIGSRLKFIQKVTPLCGSYNKTGQLLSFAPVDPTPMPPAAFTLQCGSGRVVTKLRVSYDDNTSVYPYVGGVQISCSPLVISQWTIESPQTLATTGFDSWSRKADASCGSQLQPMHALRVRSTTSVKALSIICDEP